MDFDDLGKKLDRMYRQLNESTRVHIKTNIVDKFTKQDDGTFEHRVSFGNADPIKRDNMVIDAIHAIAGLKDILNLKLDEHGYDKKLYENLINNSQPLQIITDLDNKSKHGNNLSNHRYKEDINLVNIDQALRGQGITHVSFTTDLNTGQTRLNKSSGNVAITVTGDIVNNDGIVIASLSTVLSDSVDVIEKFIDTHKLS